MILYHGTSYLKGMQIIKEKRIKRYCKGNYDDREPIKTATGEIIDYSTNKDYIYFTDLFPVALRYGKLIQIGKEYIRDEILGQEIVFKVNIDEDKLEPDYDEIRIHKLSNKVFNLEDSIKFCGSCGLKTDLLLNCNVEYTILPNSYYDDDIRELMGTGITYINYKNRTGEIFHDDRYVQLEKDVLDKYPFRKI